MAWRPLLSCLPPAACPHHRALSTLPPLSPHLPPTHKPPSWTLPWSIPQGLTLHFQASEDGVRFQNIPGGPHEEYKPGAIKHVCVPTASHVPKNAPPSSGETPGWQAGWHGRQWHCGHVACGPSERGPPPWKREQLHRDGLSLQGPAQHPQGPASPSGGPDRGRHTLDPREAPSHLASWGFQHPSATSQSLCVLW